MNLQGESYHRQMYLPVRAITPDARFRSFQCGLDIAPGEDLQWKREVVFYSFLVIRVGQNLVQAAKQPQARPAFSFAAFFSRVPRVVAQQAFTP